MTKRDGNFTLKYAQGYAVLTIEPPAEGGKQIYVDDVLARMKILRIPRVPEADILRIIEEAAGRPERLVAWPDGEKLSSSLRIELDPEAQYADVVISRPRKGGGTPTAEEVRAALTEAGVVFGCDERAIQTALAEGRFDARIRAARARPPQDGRPRIAEFHFETDTGKPFLVDDGGAINLKELNFIQQVHAHDILVTFQPESPPVDGCNIRGETLPAAPIPETNLVGPGDNTRLSDDGNAILTEIDGNAFLSHNTVCVEPIVAVDAVDYRTGNIDFEGSVLIKHGVADGFTVKAGGTLEVGESVGRVTLEAGRDLVLKGGANCDDEGRLTSGGDLYAKYLEGANAVCRGHGFIVDAVMHSSLYVDGNLTLSGKHGGLIGGTILIGGRLKCKKIGSVSETVTRIALGVAPDRLIEYMTLCQRRDRLHDRIDDLDKIVRHTEKKLRTTQDHEDAELLKKAWTEKQNNTNELRETESRIKKQRETLIPAGSVFAVVEEQIYPKVHISFGNAEFRSSEAGNSRAVLRCRDGKVIETGYNPAEPIETD